MSSLPTNWVVAPLGELLTEVLGGGTPDKSKAENFRGDIPFMTVKDMHSRFIDDTQDHISQEALASSSSRVIPADTLVIASRMSLGKIARPTRAVAINQDLKALFLQKGVSKPYIEYAWRANAARIQAMGTGTTVKGIRLEDIRGLELPVAPAAEQTRIADQLDTLLARIQACQDRLESIPALLKRFRQAVLNSAVSGTLIDVENGIGAAAWERTTVGAIASDVRYGTSKKCTYASTGLGVLRIPNIAQHGRIDLTDLKRANFDAKEVDKLALREGDLLVIRSNGSVDLVGACSVVTAAEAGLLFAGYLMRLRLDQTRALPAYVRICLSTSRQRELIERTAKSTSGVNNLNAEELRSLPLSLPTLGEQIAIVKRVEALLGLAAQIERRHAAATSSALRLTPLVLAKAFRGELVPQDPIDEPASALLARIATQRNAPTGADTASTPRRGRRLRAPKETAAMTKSRQDNDVMGQPYLAGHLRRLGKPASAEALFKVAELPVADFYKQLAWEVTQGHVKDNQTTLEPGHAAG